MAARLARGLRNNNPGNIEYKKGNAWKGKLPFDASIEPRFERFVSMEYGARALLANLRTYFNRKNNTITKILNTWAPPSENPTLAYIQAVSKSTGFDPDRVLTFDKPTASKLGKALAEFENGKHEKITLKLFENAFEIL